MSIKIYQLKNYFVTEQNGVWKQMNGKTVSNDIETIKGDAKKIANVLRDNNKGYHERLEKDDVLTLFCDLDGIASKKSRITLKLNVFKEQIKEFFYIQFRKRITRITITENKGYSKESKFGSFHVFFPEFSMTSSYQKEFWKEFSEEYNYKNNEIDVGIYGCSKCRFSQQ